MKIKTSELRIAALDWAVAKCEGTLPASYDNWRQTWPQYATLWAQGGPIIEKLSRQGLRITGTKCRYATDAPTFTVSLEGYYKSYGPTPLIAAMRCYVASKLGDEVEIPDELC